MLSCLISSFHFSYPPSVVLLLWWSLFVCLARRIEASLSDKPPRGLSAPLQQRLEIKSQQELSIPGLEPKSCQVPLISLLLAGFDSRFKGHLLVGMWSQRVISYEGAWLYLVLASRYITQLLESKKLDYLVTLALKMVKAKRKAGVGTASIRLVLSSAFMSGMAALTCIIEEKSRDHAHQTRQVGNLNVKQ